MRMRSFLRLDGTFLRSRLGRRIFLMFCVAVIVPAVAVFWLTYRTTARSAQQAGQAAMRAENKHFGLSVFERLQAAQALLDQVAAGSSGGPVGQPLLRPFFNETSFLDLPGASSPGPTKLAQALASLPLAELQTAKLVVLPAIRGGQPSIVLLNRSQSSNRILAGALRPSFLWGRAEDLPIDGQICTYAAGQLLACVGENAGSGEPGEQMSDQWDLFLKAQFASDSWQFVATKRFPSLLLSPLQFLAPLAAGLLFLVLLLSSIQIRRILVPLETLVARIRAVSRADAPLSPATDDELATLTQTFDEMERRIHTQMETLRTLAEVDRLVLGRVPLSQVIGVVMARIAVVVDVVAVGITLRRAGADPAVEHYLQGSGQAAVEIGRQASLAPLPAEGYGHPGGRWMKAGMPGPGFDHHRASRAVHIALGHREGSRIWVVLGCCPDRVPSDKALSEVRELGERIAVALAVEEHESRLVFQARHDPLTALPNRLAAIGALTLAIERASRSGLMFAAIFIDLDRFKAINDGLGHARGDVMLVHVGERIRQRIARDDFVSRLGGDEFFVIAHDLRDVGDAAAAIARLRSAFATPIVAGGIELMVGFSAGIALYPRHGTDPAQLVHNADLAMYRGKKAGGGRTEFFEEEMNAAALNRVQLENDLRLAIRDGQLHLHYQPRVDSRTGRIVGAEALARWRHPVRGDIPPSAFITLAEECGLIDKLGSFVMHEACRQLGEWKRGGLDLPVVAVNVSSHQLRSGKLVELVGNAIARGGIDWNELEIEVTESLLVNDSGAATSQLQAIREAGSTVAIDDFGTGYSSLAYLTKLPIDTLKIDRAFIANLGEDDASMAVIRSIIALAGTLGKKIVAEGVERMEHVELLDAWGCHVIQGYVFHRPLTPDAIVVELGRQAPPRAVEAMSP